MKTKAAQTSRRILLGSIAAATVASIPAAKAVDGTWIGTTSNSWANPALTGAWNAGIAAGGVDALADFSTIDLTSAITVALDGTRTIGTLKVGDLTPGTPFGYTFNAYGNGGRLIFDVSSGNALIDVLESNAASLTINAPMQLNDDTVVRMNSTTTTTGPAATVINGNISGTGKLTLINSGGGRSATAAGSVLGVTLQGINTLTGGIEVEGVRANAITPYALGGTNQSNQTNGTVTVKDNGQVFLSGGTWRNHFVLNGLGFNESTHGQLGTIRTDTAGTNIVGNITIASAVARLAGNGTAGTTTTIFGALNESFVGAHLDFGRWANGSTATMLQNFAIATATGYTGKTYISSGSLQLGIGGTVGDINSSSDVTFGLDNTAAGVGAQVNTSATLIFNRADNITFAKNISQTTAGAATVTGNLQHSGNGTVTLTGSLGYLGTTVVNSTGANAINLGGGGANKLVIGTGGAMTWAPLGNVTLSNGGDLEFNTSSNVQIGGGGTVGNTGLLATQTLLGTSGVGSFLIQSGTGSVTLSGSSDNLQGRAIVNSGTLVLNKHTNVAGRALAVSNELGLIINGGTVNFGADAHADQIGSNTDVRITTGSLNLLGKSDSFDVLTGTGGTVTNGSAVTNSTLTLGETNSTLNVGFGNLGTNAVHNHAGAYLPNYGGVIADGAAATLALTKIGTGLQILSGANTYTGATSVNAGALSITGSLAAGSAVTLGGGVLSGTGTVGGNVTVSATAGSGIRPGATHLDGSIGTLTIGALTVNGGDIRSGLTSNPAGTNDLITSTGAVNFAAASTITPIFVAAPGAGTYTLLTGSTVGGTLPTLTAPANSRYTFSHAFNGGGTALELTVSGTNKALTWLGATGTLDYTTAGNWQDTIPAAEILQRFDSTTFGDVGNRTPTIATGIGIESAITFANTSATANNINLTTAGTGKLTGMTSLAVTGGGRVTISSAGGTAHDYFGDVNISNGVLVAGHTSALGANSGPAWEYSTIGQTYVTGTGALDVNGTILQGEVINIAGSGFGGAGTIINGGASQTNALAYVRLTNHATIGGLNRWDIRDSANAVGEILDLAGYTLTKTGPNNIALVGIDMTDGTIDLNQGILTIEANTPIRSATTINVGTFGTLGAFQTSVNMPQGLPGYQRGTVNLNGGRFNELSANTNSVFSSAFVVNGDSFLDIGNGAMTLNGGITGTGDLFKGSGGGRFVLNTNNNTFNGKLIVGAGQVDIGDGLIDAQSANGGSFGNGADVINGALLRVIKAGTTNWSTNMAQVHNGELRVHSPLETDTLNISGPLGVSPYSGSFNIWRGTVNLNAGADVKFNAGFVGGTLLSAGAGVLNINAGASLTIGNGFTLSERPDGTNPGSGVLNMNGGSVTLLGTDQGVDGTFRVGHWPGAQSVYNQSGGTFSAPLSTFGVGVDNAQPLFNLSGGTLFARGFNVDTRAAGNTPFSATVNISGGELIVGLGGLTRTGTQGDILYTGGKISAGGSSNWSAVVTVEGTREFDTNGYTVGGAGGFGLTLTGSGDVNKTDNGVLSLGGTSAVSATSTGGFLTGAINVQQGVLRAVSNVAFGRASAINVSSGATFDVNGIAGSATDNSFRRPLNIEGTGVIGQAALWNSGAGVVNSPINSSINLTGDATVGGTGRNDLGHGNGLTITSNGFNLTKVGTGETWYWPTASTLGNIIIESGRFGVQNSNLMGVGGYAIINPGGELATFGVQTNSKTIYGFGGSLFNNNDSTAATWTGGLLLGADSYIGSVFQGSYGGGTARSIVLDTSFDLDDSLITLLNGLTLIKNGRQALTFKGAYLTSSAIGLSDGNMDLWGGNTTITGGTAVDGIGWVKLRHDATLSLDDTSAPVSVSKSLIMAGGILNNALGDHTLAAGADIQSNGRFNAAATTTLTLGDLIMPTNTGATFGTAGNVALTTINGVAPSTGRLGQNFVAGATEATSSFASWNGSAVAAATPTLTTSATGPVNLSSATATDLVLATHTAAGVVAHNTITADLAVGSLIAERDIAINNGALLTLGSATDATSGGLIYRANTLGLQTNSGTVGRITSGTADGALHINTVTSYETLGTQDLRVRVVDAPVAGGGFQAVRLVKNGPGGLTGLGVDNANAAIDNSFTGGLLINNGRYVSHSNTSLGLGNVVVREGGQVAFYGGSAGGTNFANNITANGLGAGENSGYLGAIRFANGQSLTGNIALATDSRLGSITSTDTAAIQGVISGSSSLEKVGAGNVVLANANNSYIGATKIGTRDLAGGTLTVTSIGNGGANSTLGASSNADINLILDGGTLRYIGGTGSTDRSFTIGINGATITASGFGALTLAPAAPITAAPGTTRTLNLAGDYESTLGNLVGGALPLNVFSGVITDPTHGFVSISKNGHSRWAITADQSGNGNVTVTNGQLVIGNGGTTGSLTTAGYVSGIIAMQNAGDLIINRSDAVTLAHAISGNGTNVAGFAQTELVQAGGGTTTLSGVLDNTALAARVESGTLVLAKQAAPNATINSGRALGNASTINGGTLQLGGTAEAWDQIFDNVEIRINGGAFDINGKSGEIIGRLEGNGGVVTNSSATAANLWIGGLNQNTASYIGYGGVIQDGTGTLGITKVGTNANILTGANTFTGGTTIHQGAINLGYQNSSGTLGSGAVTVNASGTLNLNRNDNYTFSNAVSGAGLVTQAGSGAVTLNTAQGPYVVNAVRRGTLNVDLSTTNHVLSKYGNVILDGGTLKFTGGAGGTSAQRLNGFYTFNGGNIVVDGTAGATNLFLQQGVGRSGRNGLDISLLGSASLSLFSVPANDATGIVGPWITLNGTDFAVGNATGQTLSAFTGYSNDTYTSTTYGNVTTSASPAAFTSRALRFNTAAATTLTLTGTNTLNANNTSGAIIITPNVGANTTTITGGNLTSGAGNTGGGSDLIVHQHNIAGDLVIGSALTNGVFNAALSTTTTAGSATVTVGSTTGLTAGMFLSGNANIPAGAYIVAVPNATTFTLNTGTGVLAATANTAVSNTNQLVKQGNGVLRLTAANTNSGTIVVNGGKLVIGNGSTSGSILGIAQQGITNDAQLAWNRSDAVTVSGVISGFGEVRNEGTGTLNLNAANTFVGGLTVSKGTVQTNVATGLGLGIGSTPGIVTLGDADTGAANIALNIAHTVALTIPNHINVANLGSGTVTIGSTNNTAVNAIFTGAINLGRATTLAGNFDRTTFSGIISGNPGTLTISNLTGAASGRVTLEANNDFTASTININDTAILQVGTGNFSDARNQLPDNATVNLLGSGAATLQLNGDSETIGSLMGANVNSVVQTIANGPAVLNVTGTSNFAGKILGGSGGTGLTVQVPAGASFTTSGTTDNAAGNFLVDGGTLLLGKTSSATVHAIGGVLTIQSGVARLTGTGGDQIYDGSAAGANGATVLMTGGSFDLNGLDEGIGALIGYGGTVTNSSATAATLTLGTQNTSSLIPFAGVIENGSSTVSLTKAGTGGATLTGTNTYTGTTTINGGVLQLGAGGTTGSIAASSNIVNNGALVSNRSDNTTLANTITGSGRLINNGGGDVTLTGANAYTGETVVNAGRVIVGNGGISGSLGTGKTTLAAGTEVQFNRSDLLTVTNNILGDGGIEQIGSGTTVLTALSTYIGSTDVTVGKLIINGNIARSSGTNVAVGATLGGTGTLGPVTIASGGTLSLGDSTAGDTTGTLTAGNTTLTTGSIFEAEVAQTTGSDLFDVIGTLGLGSSTLSLAIDSPGLLGTYFLARNDGADAVSGIFNGINNGDLITQGAYQFNLYYDADYATNALTGGNDIAIQFVAVPEPNTALAILTGVGMLLGLQRRRRSTRVS